MTRNVSRRRGVILVMLFLVTASFFCFLVKPRNVTATRLLLVAPTSFIHVGERTEVSIKAIDDSGNLDTSRNDIVELRSNSMSYLVSAAKLSATTVRLQKGVGSVYILSDLPEIVEVTVISKEGQPILRPFTIHLFIGIGEE